MGELQTGQSRQSSGPPRESNYARKQRLKDEGLWQPPPQKIQQTATPAVVAAPAKVITPIPPTPRSISQLKEDGSVSERKWRKGTFKLFETVGSRDAWVTVEGGDYFLPVFKIKVARLSSEDLYPGREVEVRLHFKDNLLIVKSIQLPEGSRV